MSQKKFYVGIKGLIKKDNKVLVLKTTDDRGIPYWDIPGGRIDEGEEIIQTIERELKEELPKIQKVKILQLLYAYKLPRTLQDGLGLMLIFFTLNAEIDSQVELSDEHTGYKWVGNEEIDSLGVNDGAEIEDGYRHAIKLALGA